MNTINITNYIDALPHTLAPSYPASPNSEKFYSGNLATLWQHLIPAIYSQITIQHEKHQYHCFATKNGTKIIPKCAETTSFCSIQHENDNKRQQSPTFLTN